MRQLWAYYTDAILGSDNRRPTPLRLDLQGRKGRAAVVAVPSMKNATYLEWRRARHFIKLPCDVDDICSQLLFEIEEAYGGVPSLDGAVAYLTGSCATDDQLAWLPGLLQGVEAAKEFISEDDDDRLADRPLFLPHTSCS